MQFVMNGDEGAYFKITNIKFYAEGEEVEQPTEETAAADSTSVN
jgi:hypothetical protein